MIQATAIQVGSTPVKYIILSNGRVVWPDLHAKTADAITWLSHQGVTLPVATALKLDRFVRDLHGERNIYYTTYEIWSKILVLFPFVGGTAIAHAMNLIDPGTFTKTWAGSPTHTANGTAFNGTSQYGDTGFKSLAHTGTSANGGSSLYLRSAASTAALCGAIDNANSCDYLYSLNATMYYRLYSETFGGSATEAAQLLGFISQNRIAAGSLRLQHGATSYDSGITTTGVAPDVPDYVGAISVNGAAPIYGNCEISMYARHQGLTNTEATFFSTATQAFQTALGRQV